MGADEARRVVVPYVRVDIAKSFPMKWHLSNYLLWGGKLLTFVYRISQSFLRSYQMMSCNPFFTMFWFDKEIEAERSEFAQFCSSIGSGECFSCKSWLPNKSWETKLLQWLSDFSLLPIKWRDMGGPERVVVQFSENFWHPNICLSGCGISDNLFHLASWTLHQVTALDVLVT